MRPNRMTDLVCLLFFLLFVYAGASKWLDYPKFVVQLQESPLLTGLARPIALLLPGIEIGLALLLSRKRWQLVALYASFGLMILFTTYIVVILRFSVYIPCSCGGLLEAMNWQQHLLFNSLFILLALAAILLHSNNRDLIINRRTGEAENLE